MKIKTLQRPATTERECAGDLRRQSRNLNPHYHPMQRAREYTRAVTAAKMDRMFAKPLIAGNLENGHMDSVTCTAINRRSLVQLVSGGADGQVKLWDLSTRKNVVTLEAAHTRVVTGVVFTTTGSSGEFFYSCSDDGKVHRWSTAAVMQQQGQQSLSYEEPQKKRKKYDASGSAFKPTGTAAIATWRTNGSFKSIDHHWFDPHFATASDEAVQIWTPERSSALQTFSDLWGSDDTVTTVRYNPAERCLLAHASADRGVGLHDTRTGNALRKTVLRMRTNQIEWNPMEPMTFAIANDDHNAYTFDMRFLEKPVTVFKGHVAPVMCVSWSPTGREFVTGSYDRTIRIFPALGGVARDIYHTKRMQKVFCVNYSMDNKFIVTGSDDSNLRLWKANASEKLGQLTTREEAATNYRRALIKRYQHLPEVKRIHKNRKIPKPIKNQTAKAIIMKESADRKQANRVKHDRKGIHKFTGERDKVVVKQVE